MKLLLALFATLLLAACTDPITVGSDLLGEDRAGVGETTDVSFTTRVVREDSLFILNGTTTRYVLGPSFSFGEIDEPTFGRTTHSVYLAPRLVTNAAGAPVIPPFARQLNPTIDSVVLILPVDTFAGIYGPGRSFPYRALELTDTIPLAGDDLYSNFSAATLPEELGYASTFTVSTTPSLVRDTSAYGAAGSHPHARIRLSDAFGARLGGLGPDAYETNTTFRSRFPGINLTPAAPSAALATLYPSEPPVPQGSQPPTPYSGLNVYYRDSTGNPSFFRIPILVAIPNYEYDYENALVQPLLDGEADNDLIALQGKGGLMTEIMFTDLEEWEGTVINRAVLEIPVASVEGVNYDQYPRPARLELFYRRTANGPLVGSQDKVELIRSRAGAAGGGFLANANFFLDGNLRREGDNDVYSVSFSLQMQRILDGEVPPRLYLRVYPLDAADYNASDASLYEAVTAKDPARVLLNGPDAANNPARIRLTYTTLD